MVGSRKFRKWEWFITIIASAMILFIGLYILSLVAISDISDSHKCENIGGDWTQIGCIVGDYEIVKF